MKNYELIEHTADIGIKVIAKTLEELFENAALGMFSIIADLNQIKPKEHLEIEVEAESRNELLFNWLRELLYQSSTTYIIFKEFNIQQISDKKISALAWGEKIENKKNVIKTEIKAVTYCDFKLEKKDSLWEAQVIFDV